MKKSDETMLIAVWRETRPDEACLAGMFAALHPLRGVIVASRDRAVVERRVKLMRVKSSVVIAKLPEQRDLIDVQESGKSKTFVYRARKPEPPAVSLRY